MDADVIILLLDCFINVSVIYLISSQMKKLEKLETRVEDLEIELKIKELKEEQELKIKQKEKIINKVGIWIKK